MFYFLETDIREQEKYETRIETSVDNKVNDLRYEINFQNRVKDKKSFLLSETLLFFFKQKYILFLETFIFKIPGNLIASAFFLSRQILKKHRYASAKASNAALVKLTD